MINIFLVEDEPFILRSIKNIIQSIDKNYYIIGTATNGKDAVHFINEYSNSIDIIITDIHIPIIDGLDLIAYVNRHYSNILCMILTGYSEFSYAKRAIQLDVFAYLVKPINQEELAEQLKKAYESKYLNEMRSFNSYANSNLNNNDNPSYSVAIICIGNYPFITSAIENDKSSIWNDLNINSIFEDNCNLIKDYWIINGYTTSEKIILFAFNDNLNTKEDIKKMFTPLLQFKIPITIMASLRAPNIHKVSKTLQNIRFQLSKGLVIGKSQLLFFSNDFQEYIIPDKEILNVYYLKLIQLFEQNKIELFNTELWNYLIIMKEQELTQSVVTEYLISLLSYCMKNQNINTEADFIFELINNSILFAVSYKDIYTNLISIFNDMSCKMLDNTSAPQAKNELFLQIESYIRQHYTEAINIQQIADYFDYTPVYISKIFREYKNISPHNYIINLRIKKAKKLFISNPNFKIKDVANFIGYEDPLYFSKVFRKETGLSPRKYIEQLNQEEIEPNW